MVFIVCFLADLALMAFGPAIRGMLSFVLRADWADALLYSALWGFAGAQLAMLCIWLGIMVTGLYWSLAGVVWLTVLVLALIRNDVHWQAVIYFLTVVFAFSLPYALVPVAGFRLVTRPTGESDAALAGSSCFPLSRLFLWTAIAAGVLGILRLIPASVSLGMETFLAMLAVSLIGLATVWAVLRPGSIWRPLALLPLGVLLAAVGFMGDKHGWRLEHAAVKAYAGVVFILSLAGLLAIYRAAGRRLVYHDKGALLVPHREI
jgi:hypothetical protein